jgi:hypothetical protein
MSLRETIFQIFLESMGKDPQMDMTIKLSFEKICNVDQKTPKALVAFLDDIFKKEVKSM